MKPHLGILLCALCAIGLISCYNKNHASYPISSIKEIKYTKVDLDTVYVSMNLETCSFNGYSGVDGDHLYFLDQFFCFLYEVLPSGSVLHRYLGLGNGPNEIPFRYHSGISVINNELFILGNTYDAYLFSDFKNRERFQLKISKENNSLNDSRAYTSFSEIIRKSGDKFYYNIYSEAKYCNPWEHSEEYFKNAHIIMELDLKSGELKPMGKYSKFYIENHKNVNHLFSICYDIIRENDLIISYYADSLIYILDNKGNPIEAFGYKGENMNTNYNSALPNIDDFNRVWAEDYANKGYYTWLEHIDETNMTFRSYQKGSHTEYDGLQIYNGSILIADVEVPKQFKVAGYIPPYYISQIICDEEAETMKFYKFRFN